MAVERTEGRPKHIRKIEGAQFIGARRGLRQIFTDMFPQVAIDDRISLREIVGDRHAGQLDDAALDRVHEAEIRHHPREQDPFIITRSAKEEGSGGQVIDDAHALRQFAAQRFDAVDPESGGLFVLGSLLLVVPCQRTFDVTANLVPVAMMRLVINHVNAVVIQQLAASSREHLGIGFRGPERFGRIALQKAARDLGQRQGLAMLKRMVIGDHDLGAADFRQHFRRHDFACLVVIVGLARQQHAKTVADGDARGDDQKGAGEILRILTGRVHRLPGDQHGHHGGLAAAGRHLHGQAEKLWVGFLVGLADLIQQSFRRSAFRSDFGQPYDSFDRFDLAEERTRADEFMVPPMFEQPLRRPGYAPVGRIA